jgi:putative DNA primase/helicase
MRNAHEQHPTGLAKLRGARLVFTSEIPDGSWNEEFLKSISGGGKISARFMRGDFFDFEPTFKLLLSGNTKPGLRSVDPAMRRRFNLIPFTASLSAEEVDRDLRDVKLPRERPGILAWAQAGREEFLRQGLNPPAVVRSATEEYLLEEDRFARWFEDCCLVAPERRETASDLYRSFVAWTEAEGETFVPKANWLGRELKKRGYVQLHDGRTRWWKGLQLRIEKQSY